MVNDFSRHDQGLQRIVSHTYTPRIYMNAARRHLSRTNEFDPDRRRCVSFISFSLIRRFA